LIDTIGNTTNYTVYGLTPSTAYNFTVYARDAAGNISAVSNTTTATTTRATDVPPSTPSNIVISNITSNALTISWTASTDDYGISQYHIFANSSTTALVVINSTQSTGTVTYNVTGLSPSTSYYFRIFARDIDGNFSAQDSLLQLILLLHRQDQLHQQDCMQTLLVTQKYLQGGMQQGATGYVLYRSTRANGIYDVVIDTTSINYMDNFLTPGITYYYQVLAYSGANYSARSSAVFATMVVVVVVV
jgi:chitodextrinase